MPVTGRRIITVIFHFTAVEGVLSLLSHFWNFLSSSGADEIAVAHIKAAQFRLEIIYGFCLTGTPFIHHGTTQARLVRSTANVAQTGCPERGLL